MPQCNRCPRHVDQDDLYEDPVTGELVCPGCAEAMARRRETPPERR